MSHHGPRLPRAALTSTYLDTVNWYYIAVLQLSTRSLSSPAVSIHYKKIRISLASEHKNDDPEHVVAEV